MLRIVVIGGGITGTSAAAELAREGHAVTLIEKQAVAAMASGWTLGGVRQSGRHPAELPLARAAVELWGALSDVLGVDVEYRRSGNLRLARDADEAEVIRTLVAGQQARGLDLHFLPDNAAVRTVAPALSRHVRAVDTAASVDANQHCMAFLCRQSPMNATCPPKKLAGPIHFRLLPQKLGRK